MPQGRVKRISLAQDVINPAEESVYDTLWTAKPIQSDDRDAFRIVQAGYDYLGRKTRLSKKTIQRIVAKLIDKDFIAIGGPPIYTNELPRCIACSATKPCWNGTSRRDGPT